MKLTQFFNKAKDGGPESPVDGYFLIELKGLFSIVLLKFNKGGREAFHSHAFNAITWFLSGSMVEEDVEGDRYVYKTGIIPKYTPRDKCHRVLALKDSWCLSIRGPWVDKWFEIRDNKKVTLTHGRKEVVND